MINSVFCDLSNSYNLEKLLGCPIFVIKKHFKVNHFKYKHFNFIVNTKIMNGHKEIHIFN